MYTTAFGQIRLSGQNVTTASGRLLVGGAPTMMASDSGAFTSSAVVANTGQQAWTAAQNNATNLSGNLTTTGQNLYSWLTTASGAATNNAINLSGNLTTTGQTLTNNIAGLSGLVIQTGNDISYFTGVATGSDTVWFAFPGNYVFSSTPKVVVQFELGQFSSTLYYVGVSGRATSGFYGLFSDIIAESGNGLDVRARNI